MTFSCSRFIRKGFSTAEMNSQKRSIASDETPARLYDQLCLPTQRRDGSGICIPGRPHHREERRHVVDEPLHGAPAIQRQTVRACTLARPRSAISVVSAVSISSAVAVG